MSDNGVAPQLYGPDCLQRESESEGGAFGGQTLSFARCGPPCLLGWIMSCGVFRSSPRLF